MQSQPDHLVSTIAYRLKTALAGALVSLAVAASAIAQERTPQLQVGLKDEATVVALRLTGVRAEDTGSWLLESSVDFRNWHDALIFEVAEDSGDTGPAVELPTTSLPLGGTQYFRARYLGADAKVLQDYLAARDAWRQSGFDHYVMEYRFGVSFFNWHGNITVRSGAITETEVIESNFFEPPTFLPTIDDLFDDIRRYISQNAATIDVTYDAEFGYPKSAFIDIDERIADEERSWTILKFTPFR